MSRFHSLKVSRVQRETPQAVSVTFDLPSELSEAFRFEPGQYTTLRLEIGGEQLNRSYSFCSAPALSEPLTIAVKEVFQGKASGFINRSLREGMSIQLMEPMGNFHVPMAAGNRKHYLLFAGGSGITPVFSILKSVLAIEKESRLTLFYGNTAEEQIIFRNAIRELEQSHSALKVVHVLDQSSAGLQAEKGPLDKETVLALFRKYGVQNFSDVECFVCGPTPMMKAVEEALAVLMVPKEKIHIEYFTAKAEEDKQSAAVGSVTVAEAPFTGKAKVTITYDGNTYSFDCKEKDTVLEAALEAGYDPPYSCMVAACCTCRAKLVSGRVEMDDRESLTDAEIAKGYVLTCQSHPKTNEVVLNFDL